MAGSRMRRLRCQANAVSTTALEATSPIQPADPRESAPTTFMIAASV